mmetsp:Transcript_46661/g.85473  ORF Transcript_46661/g.85473 Transcript_46661/m.85473 type:complete len:234 (-) Transcript_46661:117-818(-)
MVFHSSPFGCPLLYSQLSHEHLFAHCISAVLCGIHFNVLFATWSVGSPWSARSWCPRTTSSGRRNIARRPWSVWHARVRCSSSHLARSFDDIEELGSAQLPAHLGKLLLHPAQLLAQLLILILDGSEVLDLLLLIGMTSQNSTPLQDPLVLVLKGCLALLKSGHLTLRDSEVLLGRLQSLHKLLVLLMQSLRFFIKTCDFLLLLRQGLAGNNHPLLHLLAHLMDSDFELCHHG